jgi:hypothetical protein
VRELPRIAEWISSAGVPSNATAKDIVCNGATGTCGVPEKLLQQSMGVPIDPDTRKFYQQFRSSRAKTGRRLRLVKLRRRMTPCVAHAGCSVFVTAVAEIPDRYFAEIQLI